MHPTFVKMFNTLEDDRKGLFLMLKNFPDEKINLKPAEGKWSIVQILFHLVKTERLSVIIIEKELKSGKNKKAGAESAERGVRLLKAMKSDMQIKAPDILANVPDSYDIEELRLKWETIRVQLKEILDNLPEEAAYLELYEHPFAGKLSLMQGLDFLHHHFLHHLKQIEILSKA